MNTALKMKLEEMNRRLNEALLTSSKNLSLNLMNFRLR